MLPLMSNVSSLSALLLSLTACGGAPPAPAAPAQGGSEAAPSSPARAPGAVDVLGLSFVGPEPAAAAWSIELGQEGDDFGVEVGPRGADYSAENVTAGVSESFVMLMRGEATPLRTIEIAGQAGAMAQVSASDGEQGMFAYFAAAPFGQARQVRMHSTLRAPDEAFVRSCESLSATPPTEAVAAGRQRVFIAGHSFEARGELRAARVGYRFPEDGTSIRVFLRPPDPQMDALAMNVEPDEERPRSDVERSEEVVAGHRGTAVAFTTTLNPNTPDARSWREYAARVDLADDLVLIVTASRVPPETWSALLTSLAYTAPQGVPGGTPRE